MYFQQIKTLNVDRIAFVNKGQLFTSSFQMPSGKRLLEDFLLPALNTQAFGQFLEWVDSEEKNVFKVLYHHKNGHNWSTGSANVFVSWDKLKGRTQDSNDYFTKSRQRFRVALAKCPRLEKMPNKGDKHVEIFKILSQKKRIPKREPFSPPHLQDIKQEVKEIDDVKVFHIPEYVTVSGVSPVVCSVITQHNRPLHSVIVSPEDIRYQRRISMEGISNVKVKDERDTLVEDVKEQHRIPLEGISNTKIKVEADTLMEDVNKRYRKSVEHQISNVKIKEEVKEPKTEKKNDDFESKASTDWIKTENGVSPAHVPLKSVHRMPVVPVPERTSGIAVLRNKPKTTPLPQVIKYVPFLQTASYPKPTLYHNTNSTLSTGPESFPSTVNNLSLINIQSVQQLK